MSAIIAFYISDISSQILDETGQAGTSLLFLRPEGPGQQQTIVTYLENIGDGPFSGAQIGAAQTTYNDPGIPDIDAWRTNIALNVLPQIQLSLDNITFGTLGETIDLPNMNPGDPRVAVYVRYTSTTTDNRTGLPYDYSPGANTNDFPYAVAIDIFNNIGLFIFNGTLSSSSSDDPNTHFYWQRENRSKRWKYKRLSTSLGTFASYTRGDFLSATSYIDMGDSAISVNGRLIWKAWWTNTPGIQNPNQITDWIGGTTLLESPASLTMVGSPYNNRASIQTAVPQNIADQNDNNVYLIGGQVLAWDGVSSTVTYKDHRDWAWFYKSTTSITDFYTFPIEMEEVSDIGDIHDLDIYGSLNSGFVVDGSYWFYNQATFSITIGAFHRNWYPPVLMGTPLRGDNLESSSNLTGFSLYKMFVANDYVPGNNSGGPNTRYMIARPWKDKLWLPVWKQSFIGAGSLPDTTDFGILYLLMDSTPRIDVAYNLPTPPSGGIEFYRSLFFYVTPDTNDVYIGYVHNTVSNITLYVDMLTSYDLSQNPATFNWTNIASIDITDTDSLGGDVHATSNETGLFLATSKDYSTDEMIIYRIDRFTHIVTTEPVEWNDDSGIYVTNNNYHFFRAEAPDFLGFINQYQAIIVG